MDIEIIFATSWGHYLYQFFSSSKNYYVLTRNQWNDFGYETSFDVHIVLEGKPLTEKFSLRLLFENNTLNSHEIFTNYLSEHQETIVSIETILEINTFITMNNDYESLFAILGEDTSSQVLQKLNDVIYLMAYEPDNELLKIRDNHGFKSSLLRDQYSKKIYAQGLTSILDPQKSHDDYCFSIPFILNNNPYTVTFNFVNNGLPSRINLLIGENGVGKSQTLTKLVDYLINPDKSTIKPDKHPNFLLNLLVCSYNPNDNFYIPRRNDNLSIEYKYLGYRKYKTLDDGINLAHINNNNIFNILKILDNEYQKEIYEFDSFPEDIKITHINNLIKTIEAKSLYSQNDITEAIKLYYLEINKIIMDSKAHTISVFNSLYHLNKQDREKKEYLPDYITRLSLVKKNIHSAISTISNIALKAKNGKLEKYIDSKSWIENIEYYEQYIVFLDENDNEVFLSSGQKIYTDLIIHLFSVIDYNSLIIIDEPENTLHPNFEVGFIRLLQNVLNAYNSFAIIATHSAIIAREIPEKYINILVLTDEGIEVQKPFFRTFGANITDINNYIFDTIFREDTAFNSWLSKETKKFKTYDLFKEEYKNILSYEMLLEANSLYNLDK